MGSEHGGGGRGANTGSGKERESKQGKERENKQGKERENEQEKERESEVGRGRRRTWVLLSCTCGPSAVLVRSAGARPGLPAPAPSRHGVPGALWATAVVRAGSARQWPGR